VRGKYEKIVGRIVEGTVRHVIVHGYDYPDPRYPPAPTEGPTGAQWIGPRLLHKRRIGQLTTYREIANRMLDQFDAMLAEVAARPAYRGRVHHVRLLGTIGHRNKNVGGDDTLWADEIHGTTEGFMRLARKFEPVIDQAWTSMQVA
jgi:hypothetical protein